MFEKFVIPYEEEIAEPIHIQAAGISYCDGSYRIKRWNSGFYVMEAIASGRGTLEVNGKTFYPEKGDAYLLPIHSQHCYYSESREPWVKYWFNVNGDAFDGLVKAYHLTDVVLFRAIGLEPFFREAMEELGRVEPGRVRELGAEAVTRIICKMYYAVRPREQESEISPEGRALKDYLDRRICQQAPSLGELSRVCSRSEAQMLRIFRRDFGSTPLAYLLAGKMKLARQLLASSDISIKEIAGTVGFHDPFYFSRMFKEKNGMSPQEYHRRMFVGTSEKTALENRNDPLLRADGGRSENQ